MRICSRLSFQLHAYLKELEFFCNHLLECIILMSKAGKDGPSVDRSV